MRTLVSVLAALAVGYALLAGLLTLMQGRILYPSAGQGSAPDASTLAALGYTALPASVPATAPPWALMASPDSARGTVVVFHGNAGSALDRGYYVRALRPRGLRVVLAEYPGYGGRPGSPTEAVLVEDAVRTLRTVAEAYPGPLVVWG
ncbi:MAG: alpha/beta hydrolase, partial [Bacteroidota bacterium]